LFNFFIRGESYIFFSNKEVFFVINFNENKLFTNVFVSVFFYLSVNYILSENILYLIFRTFRNHYGNVFGEMIKIYNYKGKTPGIKMVFEN